MRRPNVAFSQVLTKIGYGDVLDEYEFQLIGTRYFKLHKQSVIDTGGLPYHITFVVGKHYVITTNIDVTDGLCNDAIGKFVDLEFDDSNTLIRVWLKFCGSDKVGRRKRQKTATLAVLDNLANEIRTANISFTSDRKCLAKRKHFP